MEPRLCEHLRELTNRVSAFEKRNFSLCLGVIVGRILTLKHKAGGFKKEQQVMLGLFEWLDWFREEDLATLRIKIEEYRSGNQ